MKEQDFDCTGCEYLSKGFMIATHCYIHGEKPKSCTTGISHITYSEGLDAARASTPQESNPYITPGAQQSGWNNGWNDFGRKQK